LLNMTLTRRILLTVAFASVATLAACRFNPQGAQKVIEQGKATAQAAVTAAPAEVAARATETPSVAIVDPAAPVTGTGAISDSAVAATGAVTDVVVAEQADAITDTEVLTNIVEPQVITDAIEATEAITVDAASLISETAAIDAEEMLSGTEIISSGVAVAEPATVDILTDTEQVARVTVTVTLTDSAKTVTQTTDSIVIAEAVTKTQAFAPAVSNDAGNAKTTVVMSGTADTGSDTTNLVVNPQDVVTATAQTAAPQTTPRIVTSGSDTADAPAQTAPSTRAVTRTRRASTIVCVVPSRRAVNLRRGPSTATSRAALLGPRSRFVATARSANGRWVYGTSAKGRGWIAASVVNCSAAPQRLTVRR
jgi:hypothetical protein